MPVIPGICDTCGNVFASGIFMDNSVGVFENTEVGPCPYCGGWGHVPDGTFNVVQGVIEVLSAPQRSIDELIRLNNLLQKAKVSNLESNEVVEKINEESPELSPLLSFLKNEDFRYWLPVMLTILNILITIHLSSNTDEPSIEVNQVINHIYQQPVEPIPASTLNLQSNPISTESKANPIKVEKIGRNASCPCGSGIKYKRCHGIQ